MFKRFKEEFKDNVPFLPNWLKWIGICFIFEDQIKEGSKRWFRKLFKR